MSLAFVNHINVNDYAKTSIFYGKDLFTEEKNVNFFLFLKQMLIHPVFCCENG